MRALSNRSLVGITLPFFGGTSRVIDAHIKFEYERARWSMDWLSNKAVSRVYGSVYPDLGDQLHQMVHLKSTMAYQRFTDAYSKKFKPTKMVDLPGSFQEYYRYGHESENQMVMTSNHITDSIKEFTYDDCYVCFAPWHDGVQIVKIRVDDRNKGIGTRVMNDLYDISEELGIPIYLTPYPGEDFEPGVGTEKKLVKRLEKWYRRLGFDVSTESANGKWSPKWWSNME